MGRNLLPLLLVLCELLDHSLCQLTVTVTSVQIKLDESKESLGPQYFLPKRLRSFITCTMTSDTAFSSEPAVKWTKATAPNDTLDASRFQWAGKLSEDKKQYISKLSIKDITAEDITNYTCAVAESSGTGGFQSRPVVSIKVAGISRLDASAWPGESITILCDVAGNPKSSSVHWQKAEQYLPANANGSLTISDLSYENDRSIFACKSNNSLGSNTAKLFLRVKNPQAYILPLIILIVEIILIAIIVVGYEIFMRRKRMQEESKSD